MISMADKAAIFSLAAMAMIESWVGVILLVKVLRFHERHSLQGYGDTDLLFGGAEDDYVVGK